MWRSAYRSFHPFLSKVNIKSCGRTMEGRKSLSEKEYHGRPRVIMWCIPRSVSTAMTKCMSFVDGAEIWLEPYVLSKGAVDINKMFDPDAEPFPHEIEGNEDIYRQTAKNLTLGGDLGSYNLDLLSPVVLKKKFDSIDPETKFVFIKDMAVGMPPSYYRYLPDRSSGFRHFFLIRNPIKVYKSWRKVLLDFVADAEPDALPEALAKIKPETFHVVNDLPPPAEGSQYVFKAANELWHHIRETVDENPVVLDIDELIADPTTMLPRLCKALNIPYSDSLLSWDPSADVVLKWKSVCPNVRDTPRYAMWFTNAFKSSSFKASSTTAFLDGVTPDIREAVDLEMPFYEEMYKLRLSP